MNKIALVQGYLKEIDDIEKKAGRDSLQSNFADLPPEIQLKQMSMDPGGEVYFKNVKGRPYSRLEKFIRGSKVVGKNLAKPSVAIPASLAALLAAGYGTKSYMDSSAAEEAQRVALEAQKAMEALQLSTAPAVPESSGIDYQKLLPYLLGGGALAAGGYGLSKMFGGKKKKRNEEE